MAHPGAIASVITILMFHMSSSVKDQFDVFPKTANPSFPGPVVQTPEPNDASQPSEAKKAKRKSRISFL
jgi:hypothetical protein